MSNPLSLRIAVIYGGMSLEHEISLMSGAGVIDALTEKGHEVIGVLINKQGEWQVGAHEFLRPEKALQLLVQAEIDCAFLALHGANGEDGRIQGLLDLLDIPYTGSGCASSALAMDKINAKTVVAAAGVPVAAQLCFDAAEWDEEKDELSTIHECLQFPVVVKAPCQGSSRGLAIVSSDEELKEAVAAILPLERRIMIEQFIEGREFTCSVLDLLGGPGIEALAVTEIRPVESDYFDYHAKYTPGATEEITPAPVEASCGEAMEAMACTAHQALGCSSWSRSDFILGPDGPVWLEVNTLPGLTATSLFPQAAAYRGIAYASLIQLLVLDGLVRRGPEADFVPGKLVMDGPDPL
ncbi:MAG: D-alanine--D-alanine ligase [Candidatus Hydrogenedens sp.]|jgi:D-alanine-D-alanine ligase|nr:D-alanine--D-alanine ligase [Candidatus Hydrogenedens sp.]